MRTKWLRKDQDLYKGFKNSISKGLDNFSRIVEKCMVSSDGNLPMVSIIVPNYNHSEYLKERLDSIYNQTYQNFEVILLDDCSTDDSRGILEEYYRLYPEKTSIVFNEKNSGHVFSQWAKGISLAKGELLWIAESDDYCELNFLEALIPVFDLEAVSLAYAHSVFVRDGQEIWTIEDYLNDLEPGKWSQSFLASAHSLVEKYFSVKNIIPNASSAIFRNRKKFDILEDENLKKLKLCGDWLIYLYLIRGGLVSYSTETKNYYRIHEKSTSLKVQHEERYFSEHQVIGEYLNRWYKVPATQFLQMKKELNEKLQYEKLEMLGPLENYFNIDNLVCNERKLNIAMCGSGFSQGGGETFPVFMANALKERGHSVTFFDFHIIEESCGVRQMLREDIPVMRMAGNLYDESELYEIFKELGIDVVHTHYLDIDAILSRNAENHSYKHIVSLHGMYEAVKDEYWKKNLISLEKLSQNVDFFVYTADKGLKFFKERGLKTDKFLKILNGLPVSNNIPISRAAYGIPEDAFLLCLASRGIPEKGWAEAIEMVKLVRSRISRPVHLMILGTGVMFDELNTTLSFEMKKYIHLVGFKSNLRDYFAASDVGILPSYFSGESCPLVLIDCLMSGKPFLTTDIGETRNQLEIDSGILAGDVIPLYKGKADVKKFAERIIEWATNKQSYEAVLSRVGSAAEKLNIVNVSEQYEKIYFKLLKK